jgi:hypothetical protein
MISEKHFENCHPLREKQTKTSPQNQEHTLKRRPKFIENGRDLTGSARSRLFMADAF